MIGVTGLEAAYEAELRGKDGGQTIEVDAKGRMTHALDEIKPTPGHTLRLTVDRDLQQVAYSALNDELAKGHPPAPPSRLIRMTARFLPLLVCRPTI